MTGMYFGETKTVNPTEPSSEGARRRRMEVHQFRFVASDMAVAPPLESERKRQKLNKLVSVKSFEIKEKRSKLERIVSLPLSLPCRSDIGKGEKKVAENKETERNALDLSESASISSNIERPGVSDCPKFGVTSVCGRRRDMEDAVSIYPTFIREKHEKSSNLHFFGLYDGHGCSHAAMKCKDRMHEIVKNEVESAGEATWKEMMTRSFTKMDKEVVEYSRGGGGAPTADCRCELQTQQCDAVGSTAVVAVVTPNEIVVSNCGDSRAVLCRNGVAIPLSTDHKPDRPDELNRIEEAGGRVIYWDGARVLGVLAMSRAIGDNYLKPYVTSEPEVTVTERTVDDECLILASDGLWDVVSNETACGVARMCLRSGRPPSPPGSPFNDVTPTVSGENFDQGCTDASILLTRLALARHSSDNVSVVVVDLKRDL
ncbi:protein phosphatase 2C 37-like [Nicotiana tomentosiformis]|uniref:protein phosphatase 2C 37-like n=1 Tax=Nicotiana tomentosiformis TaxID=4098 RepID=UPI00051BF6F5|nr:protein phosphatase 2C 37-like [Nicotiana tomentosiformis]